MKNDSFSILKVPIAELKLSDDFKEMAYCNNFKTLQDIMSISTGVLLKQEGFTQHHYQELRKILIENKAIDLLRAKPLQLT